MPIAPRNRPGVAWSAEPEVVAAVPSPSHRERIPKFARRPQASPSPYSLPLPGDGQQAIVPARPASPSVVYAIPTGTTPPSQRSAFIDDVVFARPELLPAEREATPVASWSKVAISRGTASSTAPSSPSSALKPQAMPLPHPTEPAPSDQNTRQDCGNLPKQQCDSMRGRGSEGATSLPERDSPPPTFIPSPLWQTPAHPPVGSSLLMSPLIFDPPEPFQSFAPVLHQTPASMSPTDVVSPPGMPSPDFGPRTGFKEFL